MTIFRFLKRRHLIPTRSKFSSKSGTDPINEMIAEKIIGIVHADEKDPKRIRELGIQDLGQ